MSVEILEWKDVNKTIRKLNPVLAQEINSVEGVRNFKVVKATYPFGRNIIDRGKFQLYMNGESIPFEKQLLPDDLYEVLNYQWRSVPFGVITKNSVESFIPHKTHTVPFALKHAGDTFSLLTVFESEVERKSYFTTHMHSMSSGCRSMLFLPSLSQAQGINRIETKLGIKLPPTKSFREQWEFFNKIFLSNNFNSSWHSELIFFSEDFISKIKKTERLRYKLIESGWNALSFRRNSSSYEFLWHLFVNSLPLSDKNDIFVIGTVRHLIMMLTRQAPGFAPMNSDTACPLLGFTETIVHDYQIRYIWPVFMSLANYNYLGLKPVYYSINNPAFFYTLENKHKLPAHEVMRKIRDTYLCFKDFIVKQASGYDLNDTILYDALIKTKVDFYHPRGAGGVCSDIEGIFEEDNRFGDHPLRDRLGKKAKPPTSSAFFKGCIRLKPIL